MPLTFGLCFKPSQKFRIFIKFILDSRIGIKSGGDVKFYSPGAPVRPLFSFFHEFNGGPGLKNL